MARKASGGRPGRMTSFTGEEMIVIAKMARAGRSIRAIAALLSHPAIPANPETGEPEIPARKIPPSIVGRWLQRARTPNEDVHLALAAGRMDAVADWQLASRRGARDGRHAPAKDLLIATGAIARDDHQRVTIVVGSGDLGAALLQALPPGAPPIDADYRPVSDPLPLPAGAPRP